MCIFADVEAILEMWLTSRQLRIRLKEDKNVTVNIQDYLCSSVGQDKIKNDIEKGKVDRVVIGSCSPKLHLETFRSMAKNAGLNPGLLEITNIREQASWVHDKESKTSVTSKVKGLIKGAAARMGSIEPLTPLTKKLVDRTLVIGGGIAGITTALELSDSHEVILIEKKPYLGGHMIGLSKTFPTLDCSQCILTPRMVAVHNNPGIIHVNADPGCRCSGKPRGLFNYTETQPALCGYREMYKLRRMRKEMPDRGNISSICAGCAAGLHDRHVKMQ